MKLLLSLFVTILCLTHSALAKDTVCKSSRNNQFDFSIKVVSGKGQRGDQVRLSGLISGVNYTDVQVDFKVSVNTTSESYILLRLDRLASTEKNKCVYMKIGKHSPVFKAYYYEIGTDSQGKPNELLMYAKRRSDIELNCTE